MEKAPPREACAGGASPCSSDSPRHTPTTTADDPRRAIQENTHLNHEGRLADLETAPYCVSMCYGTTGPSKRRVERGFARKKSKKQAIRPTRR